MARSSNLTLTRRRFLKAALAAAAAAAALAVTGADALTATGIPWFKRKFKMPMSIIYGSPKHHWAMVIDQGKCLGCGSCVMACSRINSEELGFRVPLGARTRIVFLEVNGRILPIHQICQHCTPSPCVVVCPTWASIKRADEITVIYWPWCIGCKYCMSACPYGARYINKEISAVDKCIFCAQRVDRGELPACVQWCPVKARDFGDLKNPDDPVTKKVATGIPQMLIAVEEIDHTNVYYVFPSAAAEQATQKVVTKSSSSS